MASSTVFFRPRTPEQSSFSKVNFSTHTNIIATTSASILWKQDLANKSAWHNINSGNLCFLYDEFESAYFFRLCKEKSKSVLFPTSYFSSLNPKKKKHLWEFKIDPASSFYMENEMLGVLKARACKWGIQFTSSEEATHFHNLVTEILARYRESAPGSSSTTRKAFSAISPNVSQTTSKSEGLRKLQKNARHKSTEGIISKTFKSASFTAEKLRSEIMQFHPSISKITFLAEGEFLKANAENTRWIAVCSSAVYFTENSTFYVCNKLALEEIMFECDLDSCDLTIHQKNFCAIVFEMTNFGFLFTSKEDSNAFEMLFEARMNLSQCEETAAGPSSPDSDSPNEITSFEEADGNEFVLPRVTVEEDNSDEKPEEQPQCDVRQATNLKEVSFANEKQLFLDENSIKVPVPPRCDVFKSPDTQGFLPAKRFDPADLRLGKRNLRKVSDTVENGKEFPSSLVRALNNRMLAIHLSESSDSSSAISSSGEWSD